MLLVREVAGESLHDRLTSMVLYDREGSRPDQTKNLPIRLSGSGDVATSRLPLLNFNHEARNCQRHKHEVKEARTMTFKVHQNSRFAGSKCRRAAPTTCHCRTATPRA